MFHRFLKLITHKVISIGLIITVIYFTATFFFSARLLIEMGDAFVIPMAFAAAVIYGRDLIGPKERPIDNIDIMMVGIFGAWLINAFDRVYRLMARLFDASLVNSHMIGYFLFMLMFFAALHIYVKGLGQTSSGVPYKRPVKGTRIILWATIIGVIFASIVAYIHEEKNGDNPLSKRNTEAAPSSLYA